MSKFGEVMVAAAAVLLILFFISIVLIIIGLIRPRTFGTKSNPLPKRLRVLKVGGLALLVLLSAIIATAIIGGNKSVKSTEYKPTTLIQEPTPTPTPTPAPVPVPTPAVDKLKQVRSDKKLMDFITNVMSFEISQALVGDKSQFTGQQALDISNVNFIISSTAYAKEFDANEVAATKKFKGKELVITGRITDFGTHMFNNISVGLNGTTFDVHANMAKNQSDWVAQMRKGQQLTLFCEGDSSSLGAVVSNCQGQYYWLNSGDRKIKNWVQDVFDGKAEVSKSDADAFATLVVAGQLLPDTSSCKAKDFFKNDNMNKCDNEINALGKADSSKKKQIEEISSLLKVKVATNKK